MTFRNYPVWFPRLYPVPGGLRFGGVGGGAGAPVGNLMLDLLPGAIAGLSMSRRLSSVWSGYLFRLQRSDNNTPYDIPFTASGYADIAYISQVCSNTSGIVNKIYDQSGSGNDFNTATIGEMPPCYESGAIVQVNSFLSARYNGSNHKLQLNTNIASRAVTLFAVLATNSKASNTLVSGPNAGDIQIRTAADVWQVNRQNQAGIGSLSGWVNSLHLNAAVVAVKSTSAATNLIIGVNSNIQAQSYSSAFGVIRYIGEKGDTGTEQVNGRITEVVLYPTMVSTSDIRALHNHQISYYAIQI